MSAVGAVDKPIIVGYKIKLPQGILFGGYKASIETAIQTTISN